MKQWFCIIGSILHSLCAELASFNLEPEARTFKVFTSLSFSLSVMSQPEKAGSGKHFFACNSKEQCGYWQQLGNTFSFFKFPRCFTSGYRKKTVDWRELANLWVRAKELGEVVYVLFPDVQSNQMHLLQTPLVSVERARNWYFTVIDGYRCRRFKQLLSTGPCWHLPKAGRILRIPVIFWLKSRSRDNTP